MREEASSVTSQPRIKGTQDRITARRLPHLERSQITNVINVRKDGWSHLSARIPPVAHPRISPTTNILAEMLRKVEKTYKVLDTQSVADFPV